MDNIFDTELTPQEKADFIKQCDEYLEKLQRLHEQMARDQEEIDRTTAATWELLAQMRKAA